MSDGKGADDLHVFDELLKSKSSDQAVDPNSSAAWRGGTLPPPPIGLAGGLMAPVGRVTGHPPTSPALSQVPPPPPGRTSSTAPPMTSLTSMRPAPAPVSRVPLPLLRGRPRALPKPLQSTSQERTMMTDGAAMAPRHRRLLRATTLSCRQLRRPNKGALRVCSPLLLLPRGRRHRFRSVRRRPCPTRSARAHRSPSSPPLLVSAAPRSPPLHSARRGACPRLIRVCSTTTPLPAKRARVTATRCSLSGGSP